MSTLTRSENLREEQLLSLPHIGKAEMIDGEDVMPGFTLRQQDLFAQPNFG